MRLALLLPLPLLAHNACAATTPLPQADVTAHFAIAQPVIVTRAKPLLEIDGLVFKDLNARGALDP
jgi:hypothetical protein